MIEIDFAGGKVSRVGDQHGIGASCAFDGLMAQDIAPEGACSLVKVTPRGLPPFL